MAFELELPGELKSQGWKVKIRDRERLEPPHVTTLFKTRAWRLNLRTGRFIEQDASWRGVDDRGRAVIDQAWGRPGAEWDAVYPGNPVSERE